MTTGFPFRVGEGWDVHQLVAGRKLILGGVEIPHTTGLLGHSDADVLLHAITDALLGAAALGDIGKHFPDTDPMFAGADSRTLLREVAHRVVATGYTIGNIDATIIAQQRVDDCVQQDVGIRVAEQAQAVRDGHAADDQFAAFDQCVAVIAHANAKGRSRVVRCKCHGGV